MENSEYEIQHFGFSANQITLERKHSIKKFLSSALDSIIAKIGASPETTRLMDGEKGTISEEMFVSFLEPLMALESLDRRYFSIPSNVLLPSDYEQQKIYSADDENQLDEAILQLKKVFLENNVMIAALKAENELYESTKSFMDDEIFVQQQVLCIKSIPDLQEFKKLMEMASNIR